MALLGTVRNAEPGLIGFDWNARLNAAHAAMYATKGFRFCVRYVSRDDPSRAANTKKGSPDLSEAEASDILASGMALMAVQHVSAPGWSPTGQLGDTYGRNAAIYAADAGLPANVNLWLDLEGVKPGTASADVVAYCNAWFAAVSIAGYTPGVYVGFDAVLSPDELFLDLKTQHYWRAAGNIPDISHRGYQLFQHTTNPGTPQEFDRDVTGNDALGGSVAWLAPD